jgi:hypothetical protein
VSILPVGELGVVRTKGDMPLWSEKYPFFFASNSRLLASEFLRRVSSTRLASRWTHSARSVSENHLRRWLLEGGFCGRTCSAVICGWS